MVNIFNGMSLFELQSSVQRKVQLFLLNAQAKTCAEEKKWRRQRCDSSQYDGTPVCMYSSSNRQPGTQTIDSDVIIAFGNGLYLSSPASSK